MANTNRYQLFVLLVYLCAIRTSLAQTVSESSTLYDLTAQNGNEFGTAMAIDGDRLVASAANARSTNSSYRTGVVYVFDTPTNIIVSELNPPDTENGSSFGSSVDICSNLVVVGAKESNRRGESSGSAYLFDSETGELILELIPSISGEFDRFGTSVSISEGLVAVGATRSLNDPGRVHLFSSSTGDELLILQSPTPSPNDKFGGALQIYENLLVVGSAGSDAFAENAGAAYIFDTTRFELIHSLSPSDTQLGFGRGFGTAISAHSGLVAVTAFYDHEQRSRSGAVYLFDIRTGTEVRKIKAENPTVGQSFGASISLSKELLAVGTREDYYGHISGVAYVMSTHSGRQLATLAPSDGRNEYLIGQSIAINDGYDVWAGAPGHREPSNNWETGAVYSFDCFGTICPADLSGDLMVNFFDVNLLLNYYTSNDSRADFNDDGNINFYDISSFLESFLGDCL